MPEGDTLHRAAAGLRPVLVGEKVTRFESPLPGIARAGRELVGESVAGVEAIGKHLLISFSGGRALRTHLRMTGAWHLYRPGDAWKKPERRAKVVIGTERAVAVCFSAPEVEIISADRAAHAGRPGRVGPDLLHPDVDLDDVVHRWGGRPELPIGVAIMRQHLASGIGNVYKSEVLFLCRVDPFTNVGDLAAEQLLEIVSVARREMLMNLTGGPRTTRRARGGSRYWVYGRSGKRCYECGSTIGMRRQGDDGRSTYFCLRCQAPGAPPASPG